MKFSLKLKIKKGFIAYYLKNNIYVNFHLFIINEKNFIKAIQINKPFEIFNKKKLMK